MDTPGIAVVHLSHDFHWYDGKLQNMTVFQKDALLAQWPQAIEVYDTDNWSMPGSLVKFHTRISTIAITSRYWGMDTVHAQGRTISIDRAY